MHLKFSQELKPLIERSATQPITLAELLAETSEQSFGLVIALLTLPFLLPMPPGVSSISGGGVHFTGTTDDGGLESSLVTESCGST